MQDEKEQSRTKEADQGDASSDGISYRSLAPLPSPMPSGPVGIAEMANIFRVTHRTLHFYEEKGLISPERIGHMRAYTLDDINDMAIINTFRQAGVAIATIQEVMEEIRSAGSGAEAKRLFHGVIRKRKRELTAELSTIRRQVQQINDILALDEADSVTDDQDTIELSDTERKCLELMAEGYGATRLAQAIGLSAEELQKLEAGIIRKFDANNRFQAVAKAVLMGIIAA